MYNILTKQLPQDQLLSHPRPLLFCLCSTTTPLNWDLSPGISVFTGIIGMRPDSAILDVSSRIKLCQVCESGFQLQFFQSSGNLSLVHGLERLRVAYIKVLSELNVTLSSKIDFSEDRIGSLGGRLVAHVLHGIDQVRTSDSLIVVLLISSMPITELLITHKVHLLELCSQASNLLRSELSSRVQSSLIRLET